MHGWERSKTFVDVFRSLQPTLPAALTTYGAAAAPYVLPIDYASWRNAGFDLLPQAYYNQFPKVVPARHDGRALATRRLAARPGASR